jgi:hypothetical protein
MLGVRERIQVDYRRSHSGGDMDRPGVVGDQHGRAPKKRCKLSEIQLARK